MEVYVIEEPDVPTTDPTYKAVCQVIGHQATELHKEFVERGAQEGISPHFDLMDIAAQLLNFREGQKGFEKILAEAAAEDSEISDQWLTVATAGKALDSIYHQLFNVAYHYTEMIIALNERPEKCDLLTKTAAEMLEQRCAEDPRFEKIYGKFMGYDDTSEQPTEGSHHLPGQADDQLPDAPQP